MQDYKRLRVSNHSREVIRLVYEFTQGLPPDERFALSSQLRRAAISIGLNIVEGCSRSSTKELTRYLEIARGSGQEVDFALAVTEDLNMGSPPARAAAQREVLSILRELSSLITALRRRRKAGKRM